MNRPYLEPHIIGSGDGKPGRCLRIRYGITIAKAVRVNRPYLTFRREALLLIRGNLRQLRREKAFLFFLVQRQSAGVMIFAVT